MRVWIATESGETLAAGDDPPYVVIDLARPDVPSDARIVRVMARVCDSEAGILDVEAAVSFFALAIPAEYGAI